MAPPLWQTTPAPPAPLPPRGAEEEPPKKQLQDTSTMVREEDGRPASPPKKKKEKKPKRAEELGGEVRGKVNGGARALPAVGYAPTTATMTPEPGRQLLVNTAAAVAVLVGVIVAVWRTLQS